MNGQFPMQSSRPLGLPFGVLAPPSPSPSPGYFGFRVVSNGSLPPRSSTNINPEMEQDRVYCVICQEDYSPQDRESHIKKHQRAPLESDHRIHNAIKEPQSQVMNARPIVEPEEYNVQYDPNQYVL
jgi:hypothetical protein